MPMYNLIEYSDNYSKTSGSLWQYYRDEPFINKAALLLMLLMILIVLHLNLNKKITGQTGNDGTKDVQIMVPLKYLNNF